MREHDVEEIRSQTERSERPFACVLLWVACAHLCAGIGLQYVPHPEPLSFDDFTQDWVAVLILNRPAPEAVRADPAITPAGHAGGRARTRARPWRSPSAVPEPRSGYLGADRVVTEMAGLIDEVLAPLFASGLALTPQDPVLASFVPDGRALAKLGPRPGRRGATQPTPRSLGPLTTSGGHDVGLGGKEQLVLAPPEEVVERMFVGLTPEQVAALIQANIAAVNDCYTRALRYQGDLGGRIVVEAEVTLGGRVSDAAVIEDQLAETEIGACLTSEVQRWRFPAAKNAYAVRLPFILARRGG